MTIRASSPLWLGVLVGTLALAGCGDDEVPIETPPVDAGGIDAPAANDAGPRTDAPDLGILDSSVDAGPQDGEVADEGPGDDGGSVDADPDGGASDVGESDAGELDLGGPDLGPPDVGTPDTGPVDGGPVDLGPLPEFTWAPTPPGQDARDFTPWPRPMGPC